MPGCFSKKTHMDLEDLVLTGLENLKIVKQYIVLMIVKRMPSLMMCLGYGGYACYNVNASQLLQII